MYGTVPTWGKRAKKSPIGKGWALHKWWCSSLQEEAFLPHGRCRRRRGFILIAHPRANAALPRICSLPQATHDQWFDSDTAESHKRAIAPSRHEWAETGVGMVHASRQHGWTAEVPFYRQNIVLNE